MSVDQVDVRIHRTVFTIEVLSRGPFDLDALCFDDTVSDLAAIDYAISEGADCIGALRQTHTEIVPPEAVDAALKAVGNTDGSFFDPIDDDEDDMCANGALTAKDKARS